MSLLSLTHLLSNGSSSAFALVHTGDAPYPPNLPSSGPTAGMVSSLGAKQAAPSTDLDENIQRNELFGGSFSAKWYATLCVSCITLIGQEKFELVSKALTDWAITQYGVSAGVIVEMLRDPVHRATWFVRVTRVTYARAQIEKIQLTKDNQLQHT